MAAAVERTGTPTPNPHSVQVCTTWNVTRRNMSTGARAMATALVLEADGRRKDGRWMRGSVREVGAIYESVNSDSSWTVRLAECGVVLDFKPDLAPLVVGGVPA